MPDTFAIAAHAKINLVLRILSRETSGYHGIETIFALLELADELVVERSTSGITIEVDGADTGPAEDNLAYRAAHAVLKATGNRFGVRLRLTKRIPVQSGLGGGSSDAAASLHAVNALASNAVPRPELLQLAARLGADVPFFASGAAMALGWNRGERLFRLPAPPAAPALLAIPPVGVPTAKAYGLLDRFRGEPETGGRGAVVLDMEAMETWGGLGRLGGNDFESTVGAEEPTIQELFERVARTRPLLVRMSGSGSAIVGIYRTNAELESAEVELGHRNHGLIKTSTRPEPAPGPVAVDAPPQ